MKTVLFFQGAVAGFRTWLERSRVVATFDIPGDFECHFRHAGPCPFLKCGSNINGGRCVIFKEVILIPQDVSSEDEDADDEDYINTWYAKDARCSRAFGLRGAQVFLSVKK